MTSLSTSNTSDFYELSVGEQRDAMHFLFRKENATDNHLDWLMGTAFPDPPPLFQSSKTDGGTNLYDMHSTEFAVIDIISEKLKALLEDNHFTGWGLFPVNLVNRNGEKI